MNQDFFWDYYDHAKRRLGHSRPLFLDQSLHQSDEPVRAGTYECCSICSLPMSCHPYAPEGSVSPEGKLIDHKLCDGRVVHL